MYPSRSSDVFVDTSLILPKKIKKIKRRILKVNIKVNIKVNM